MCKELLKNIDYDEGTLLDFFTMSSEDIENDIAQIYPLVASLSDGQRAGIELLTLEDLVMIGGTDENGYKDASYDELETASIYDDVNRAIYELGGVALTSVALRAKALETLSVQKGGFLSPLTYVLIGITSAAAIALGVSVGRAISASMAVRAATSAKLADTANEVYLQAEKSLIEFNKTSSDQLQNIARLEARSSNYNLLAEGLGFAVIILIAFTTYSSWRDLKNHYKVDYTPIPRYMVDEKDITAYNANGEKIVIKNQNAYYTAALCNRDPSAEYYEVAKDIADLNGDVGQQWLALYCAKNKAEMPILAASLKAVGKKKKREEE